MPQTNCWKIFRYLIDLLIYASFLWFLGRPDQERLQFEVPGTIAKCYELANQSLIAANSDPLTPV